MSKDAERSQPEIQAYQLKDQFFHSHIGSKTWSDHTSNMKPINPKKDEGKYHETNRSNRGYRNSRRARFGSPERRQTLHQTT
ncbi:MAG: hypothetical protein AAF429_06010 [Pseudomonadota bacterium]